MLDSLTAVRATGHAETLQSRAPSSRASLRPLIAAALGALVGLSLALLLAVPGVHAQGNDQVVDSLEATQHKIEALVGERLSALMPRQTYVLRAMVLGHKITVPRGSTSTSGTYDLPGFRPSAGQPVASEDKYIVDQVIVRIVLNDELSPQDVQYLRTIVPILADFRTERGDRLDLQALPAFNRPANGQPSAAGSGQQPGAQGQQPGQYPPGYAQQMPYGQQPQSGQGVQGGPDMSGMLPALGTGGRTFGATDWILIGLLALILLATLIVLMRVFLMKGTSSTTAYAMPSYAAAAPMGGMASAPMPSAQRGAQPAYGLTTDEFEQQRYFEGLKSGVVKVLFARPDIGRLMVQEWQSQSDKLNLLIHALGPQVARQALLQPLGMARYRDLEEEARSEQAPDKGKMVKALQEANLYLISRELEHPEEIKVDPFAFLDGLSKGQVAHLVKDEPVKVKAIVLSRLKPEDMAFVIEQYDKDVQLEIAVNIGNLLSLPLDMLEGVAHDLAQKARYVPDARSVDIEGATALVDLMGRASQDTSRYLLQAMKSKDRKLSEAVEKRFFLFDALPLVGDDVLAQAVRGMQSAVVVTALTGAPQDLQRKVLMAFPENARPGLANSLRASKAEPTQVEEARRQVVTRFQALARQGKIDLKQISDAWQAQVNSSQPAA